MANDGEGARVTDERDVGRRPTLSEVDHTNPHTDEAFGNTQIFGRGKIAAADGGEVDSADGSEADVDSETADRMRDVDHTPPGAADGAQAAYDRGYEENE